MSERAAVPEPEAWPTSDEVAVLLRARTKDTDGRELGRFTDDTRPTGEQVGELIATAAQQVAGELSADVPVVLLGAFTVCVKLYTVCLIEQGYFGEQVDAGRSARDYFWQMYERAILALSDRIDSGVGDDGLAGSGIGNLGLERPYGDPRVSRLGSPPQFPDLATASVNYDDIDPATRDWVD